MSAAPAAANMHTTQSSAWDGCDRLSSPAGRKAVWTEQMPASARACATCIAVATPGSSTCVEPASSSSARTNRVATRVATGDAADLYQNLFIWGVYSGHASRGSSPDPVAVRAVPAAALILFAHGARDPRWAEPFEAMRAALQSRDPGRRVELAYLELMSPSLIEVAAGLYAEGIRHARVVPLFLATGGHLRRDLPATVEAIGAALPGFTLDVQPPLGESPEMRDAIVGWLARM